MPPTRIHGRTKKPLPKLRKSPLTSSPWPLIPRHLSPDASFGSAQQQLSGNSQGANPSHPVQDAINTAACRAGLPPTAPVTPEPNANAQYHRHRPTLSPKPPPNLHQPPPTLPRPAVAQASAPQHQNVHIPSHTASPRTHRLLPQATASLLNPSHPRSTVNQLNVPPK